MLKKILTYCPNIIKKTIFKIKMPSEIFVTQRINAENISSIVGNINYSNNKEIIFFV